MIKLQFSPQEIQVLLKALGAMPLNESVNTFMSLQQQLAQQPPNIPTPGTMIPTPPFNGADPGQE